MLFRFYSFLLPALLSSPAIAVEEFRLDNGLVLLVKEDHRAPVVVSQVWYRVGGSYEHDGITGISHALEHMMFQGTRKFRAGEFSRIIAENGGTENAFTAADFTAYFQTLERSRLEVAFRLEADRMRNLSIAPPEFDKEMKVVREERRLRTEDEPESYASEVAMATAFQSSPYRQPVIGWMADLEAMRPADLKSWYRRWYAPNNAVVVVAGDVDPEAVYRLARSHFGALKAEQTDAPAWRPEAPQRGIKRVTVKRPAEVPLLIMVWKAPVLATALRSGAEPWEAYALEVLTGILGGGSSARFATRIVRGREVAAWIGTDYQFSARLDGVFTIEGTPASGLGVAELENAVRAELEELRSRPVDEKELERVKAQVVSQDVYQKDSIFYQAMVLGIFESAGLGWERVEEYVPGLQAVTPEQVQAVVRKYLVDDGLTVAVLDPQPIDPNAPPRRATEPHGHTQ
ncbi:MAG: insulinase family protein [Gammaproteobacteria bacterium]|nr:insulinase family protein [Gammaproteobacteria bacterium]